MASRNRDRRRRSTRDASSRDAQARSSSRAARNQRSAQPAAGGGRATQQYAARGQRTAQQQNANRRPANSRDLSRQTLPDPSSSSRGLSRQTLPDPSASSQGLSRQTLPDPQTGSRGAARQAQPRPQAGARGASRQAQPAPSGNARGAARQAQPGPSANARNTSRRPTPDPYTRWTDPRSAELRKNVGHAGAVQPSDAPARQANVAASRDPRDAQANAAGRNASARASAPTRNPQIRAIPTGAAQERQPEQEGEQQQLRSTRVGTLRRAERAERLRKSTRRYILRIVLVIGIVVALLAGWAALYNSPAFTIEEVKVNGVEHLTGEEMTQLANVPMDSTLLRVDTDVIANRIKKNSWVADVQINRLFPNTLEINVTERPIKAIVEITSSSGSSVKQWAIAEDHIWLMPIPEQGSEAAKTTSAKIYEDAEAALHIVDVPYGTKAEIGEVCTDDNVNNALDIIAGMTTDLSDRVVEVSAAGPAETTLVLDDGVEIAFGKAEDIRDKERVILKILEENPDGVAYINVRMVETPTWRSI